MNRVSSTMIAMFAFGCLLAGCGNSGDRTPTDGASSLESTTSTPNAGLGPLQTAADFQSAAATIGATLKPCTLAASSTCVAATQQADPMFAAIAQAAEAKGWTRIVDAATEARTAGSVVTGCGADTSKDGCFVAVGKMHLAELTIEAATTLDYCDSPPSTRGPAGKISCG